MAYFQISTKSLKRALQKQNKCFTWCEPCNIIIYRKEKDMTNSDVKVIVASLELILKLLKEKDPKAIENLEEYINSLKSQN